MAFKFILFSTTYVCIGLHTTLTVDSVYPLGYLDWPRVCWVHHHCVLTGRVNYEVRVVVTENGNGDHQHTCGYGIETLLDAANVEYLIKVSAVQQSEG